MRSIIGQTVLFILVLSARKAVAQPPAYPKAYFRNPLNIPILLAGNFGECRPGHFHSGIDIRTAGVENQPVFAAAEGYISRIKTEPGGFGHALYITHPNGFTTLYAHLNHYVPKLQAFLRQQQYSAKSWTVDITLKPGDFPVKKGGQIAWSGNTGASTAPHLHFEIRDSKTEHPLNPMLFGLSIKDELPPVALQLAVYDGNQSIYNQTPQLIPLKKSGNGYMVADTIIVHTPNAGIGIVAEDFMNGSTNTLNFYTAEWTLDGEVQGRVRLDDIGYEETRYLHAYADYKTKQLKDKWVQLLFQLPGNKLGHIYEALNSTGGTLGLVPDKTAELKLSITDAPGNSTVITAWIRNMTMIRPKGPACIQDEFQEGVTNTFSNANIRATTAADALYQHACMPFGQVAQPGAFSDRFTMGAPYVPIHSYFPLYLKPNRPVPFALRNRLVIRYSDGKEESGKAATFHDDGWYTAQERAFGDYWLAADTLAPAITLQGSAGSVGKGARISFTIKDDMTSVKTATATIDGQWRILEQHGSNWFTELEGDAPSGKHTLEITATDENGNVRKGRWAYTR